MSRVETAACHTWSQIYETFTENSVTSKMFLIASTVDQTRLIVTDTFHGDTAHVKRLLHSIEDDIHRLTAYIRSLRRTVHTSHRVVVPVAPVNRSPWGGYNSGVHSNRFSHGHAPYGNASFGRPPIGNSPYGSFPTRTRSFSIGGGSSRVTFSF